MNEWAGFEAGAWVDQAGSAWRGGAIWNIPSRACAKVDVWSLPKTWCWRCWSGLASWGRAQDAGLCAGWLPEEKGHDDIVARACIPHSVLLLCDIAAFTCRNACQTTYLKEKSIAVAFDIDLGHCCISHQETHHFGSSFIVLQYLPRCRRMCFNCRSVTSFCFDSLGTARAFLKQMFRCYTVSMLCRQTSAHLGTDWIQWPGFQWVQASEEYIKTRQQSIVNGDIKGEAPAPEAGQKITL